MGLDCPCSASSCLQAGGWLLDHCKSRDAGADFRSVQYKEFLTSLEQALFCAAIILLVEKTFLQFVAISFHRKALADRLAENRLGLKALDCLSNAQPHLKKTHKHYPTVSLGFTGHKATHGQQPTGQTSAPGSPIQGEKSGHVSKRHLGHAERKRKRRKAMANIIVDHLGSAIGQVTLKDSKFNRQGEMGGLSSATRLARKLFASLSDVTPHRSHLVVDGTSYIWSLPLRN